MAMSVGDRRRRVRVREGTRFAEQDAQREAFRGEEVRVETRPEVRRVRTKRKNRKGVRRPISEALSHYAGECVPPFPASSPLNRR